MLRISSLLSLMWPRRKCHKELSLDKSLDAWLPACETIEAEPIIVDPWRMYSFPCLVPYITIDFPFPLICITPLLTYQEKPFESIAPTETRFFLSFGTWQTSIKVLNNPIIHYDLYRAYANYLARSIVTHQNITTRLLLICYEPASMWTRMIRTTWVQYPSR